MLMQKQRFFSFFLFIVLFSYVNLLSVEDFDIFYEDVLYKEQIHNSIDLGYAWQNTHCAA